MGKKIKKVKIKYQYHDTPSSEKRMKELVEMVMRDNMRKRKELVKTLKSKPYQKLYKQLRKRKSIIADFVTQY